MDLLYSNTSEAVALIAKDSLYWSVKTADICQLMIVDCEVRRRRATESHDLESDPRMDRQTVELLKHSCDVTTPARTGDQVCSSILR